MYSSELTLQNLIRKGRSAVRQAGQIEREVDWLLARKCGYSSLSSLYLNRERVVEKEWAQKIEIDIQRLVNHCPLEYILGEALFDEEWIEVNSFTLIPRPETEELFGQISWKKVPIFGKFLDLCCGSGCLALGLKKRRPDSSVFASDLCPYSLEVAKRNAKKFDRKILFKQGSWFEPWEKESFDFIVSNPPYLSAEEWGFLEPSVTEFEPKQALVAGQNGLEGMISILKSAGKHLRKNGFLILEAGWKQSQSIRKIAYQLGWKTSHCYQDSFGKDRFILLENWSPI